MSITLPLISTRYLFDRTGTSPDNLVTGETHKLPPVTNRIIVPRNGAYYADSLVIRNNKRTLINEVDYETATLYHDATEETGKQVNVMIVFLNPEVQGEVELTYQVVGGKYTGIFESIQQYVNALLVDPRAVSWEDIRDKPEFYVPADHFHDVNDIYGLNELIPQLEDIRQAIMRLRSTEFRAVYNRMIELRGYVDSINDTMMTKLNNGLEIITGASGSLNRYQTQIDGLGDRVTVLENSTAVKDLKKVVDAKDKELLSKINALESSKATKAELTSKATEILNEFTKYFKDGKLKNGLVNLDPDRHNRIELTNKGLRVKFDKPSIKGSGVSDSIYVDAVEGNDTTGNGSQSKPYRTFVRAMDDRLDFKNTSIHLKKGQIHIVPPNNTCMIYGNSLMIRGYGTGDIPIIQFGRDDRAPFVYSTQKTNNCISMSNGSLIFYGIHIRIRTDNTSNVRGWQRPVIGAGEGGAYAFNAVRLDGDCKVDFGSQNEPSCFWGAPHSGYNSLVIAPAVLENGNIEGNGIFYYEMDNRNGVNFGGSRDNDGGLIYKPNDTAKAIIAKHFPQLKKTIYTYRSTLSNLDINTLPQIPNEYLDPTYIKLKTGIGERLRVNEDKELYVKEDIHIEYYLDAENGNDVTGDGSKAKPYRSLKSLLLKEDKFPSTATVDIFLKQEQTHTVDIDSSYHPVIHSRVVNFKPYVTSGNSQLTDIVNQPSTTIQIRKPERNSYNHSYFIRPTHPNTEIKFYSVYLDIHNVNGSGSLALNTGRDSIAFEFDNCGYSLTGNGSFLLHSVLDSTSFGTSNVDIKAEFRDHMRWHNARDGREWFVDNGRQLVSGDGTNVTITLHNDWIRSQFVSKYDTLFSNITKNGNSYANNFHINLPTNLNNVTIETEQQITGKKIFRGGLNVVNDHEFSFKTEFFSPGTEFRIRKWLPRVVTADLVLNSEGIFHNGDKLFKVKDFDPRVQAILHAKYSYVNGSSFTAGSKAHIYGQKIVCSDPDGVVHFGSGITLNDGGQQLGIGKSTDDNRNSLILYNNTSGTTRYGVHVSIDNGTWYFHNAINAPNVVNRSDIRLKEDIKPIQDALSKIKHLTGYHYKWKKDGKASDGLIAQEVETVLPNSVTGNDEKAVDYNGVLALLLNAVKELDDKVERILERIGNE